MLALNYISLTHSLSHIISNSLKDTTNSILVPSHPHTTIFIFKLTFRQKQKFLICFHIKIRRSHKKCHHSFFPQTITTESLKVFSGIRVAQYCVLQICPCSFGHCNVCPLILDANTASFQPYYGDNKLIFYEMMMTSALYQTNTLNLILNVIDHPQVSTDCRKHWNWTILFAQKIGHRQSLNPRDVVLP